MRTFIGIAICLAVIALATSHWLSRPIFDAHFVEPPFNALSVASAEEAVTLARSVDGRVLLVASANAEGLSVLDLNAETEADFASPMEAYNALGYAYLQRLEERAHVFKRVSWSDLDMPVDAAYPNIAAGTNYQSHAEEVGHEGDPFLFPKLSQPTPWNADVVDGARLDYEVEVCVVPLEAYTAGTAPVFGYILCNDFTDRWLLVRDIDLDGAMGASGFPVAKGGETRMPVGPLLVIPRREDFYKLIQLELYVDGTLRQRAAAENMIWSPREILDQALAQCRAPFDLEGKAVSLGSCDGIEAGTLILTGTPEGVMFHPATIWSPWAYLRPGQTVSAYATFLGRLENAIVPSG